MHLLVKFSFLFISLLFCLKASAEIKVTTKYSEIRKIAEEKIKKYGAKDLLIVLDIDNTTLTMPQQLGSDQWFGWQYRVCKRKEKECPCRDQGLYRLPWAVRLFCRGSASNIQPLQVRVLRKQGN